jgi:hypothetical protein
MLAGAAWRAAPGIGARFHKLFGASLRSASVGPFRRASMPGGREPHAAARPPLASCQGVNTRGPEAVIAIVNSKCAASDPSCE